MGHLCHRTDFLFEALVAMLRTCVFLRLPYISAAQLRLGACANGSHTEQKLFEILNTVDHDHVIMAGDWNHGLDTSLDYAGYTGSIPRPRQREKLLQCIA